MKSVLPKSKAAVKIGIGYTTKRPAFFQFSLTPIALNLTVAVALVLLFNFSFWQRFLQAAPITTVSSLVFAVSCFLVLVASITLLLSLFAFKFIQKPVLMALLLVSAFCTYFLCEYGIPFDGSTVENVLESDFNEAREYFHGKVIVYAVLLGILPGWLISRTRVFYPSFKKQLLWAFLSSVLSIILIAVNFGLFYQSYSSLFRNHRELRLLVNPLNYLYATPAYLLKKTDAPEALIPIAEDATMPASPNAKNILVMVVGETARADHFSLNGYTRNTNPLLANQEIFNFTQVQSCGTATAVSLPCMFSHFSRQQFSVNEAKKYHSVLDVLKKVGVDVIWRDNNSGCKGICDRVTYEDVSHLTLPDVCNDKECFDEVLLHNFEQLLNRPSQNLLIVLHQKGSHGPAYYQRTPQTFKKFKPECQTGQLQDCSQQEIINAYDNSILYTDSVLSQLIDVLKQHTDTHAALLYMSDHGESLGENNVYLHGMPYSMAPSAQTHIPMLMWLSPLQQQGQMDSACLKKHLNNVYSHDNLFHSLLGFFYVSTNLYQADLDWFALCGKSLAASDQLH